MTDDHRHCHSSRCYGFWTTLLASAALSASITYVLFSTRPSNALGNEPRKHDALSQDVSVDAKLVKVEGGWSIELKATNTGAAERKCRIATALTRTQSNMMSRVMPAPRTVWTSAVAVTVPAHGESPERLAIPTNIAKDIAEPKPVAAPTGIRDHYAVQVQASCGDNRGGQAS